LEVEPYVELMWEDCCGTPPINPRDMLNLSGIYLPRLDPDGKLDATFELVRTNHISYRHDTFSSGYTYKDRMIGHPLGPDALGIYGQFRYFYSDDLQMKLLLAFELRGREEQSQTNVDITAVYPSFQEPEQRQRAQFEMNFHPNERILISPHF